MLNYFHCYSVWLWGQINLFKAKRKCCVSLSSFLGVFIDKFHGVTLGEPAISPSVLPPHHSGLAPVKILSKSLCMWGAQISIQPANAAL